jgi:TolB-like protein/class 3 adenylate cyclase
MERRLSAIFAADVVGYSALMEKDEAGTFERLRMHRREIFEPEINKHHGRIFKLMGDGLLAEFGSVVDAVECAVALQRRLTERNSEFGPDKRIEVRIGINLGDVIVEDKDLHGEGVNIAARLQQLAPPGGICLSGKVAKEVEKKVAFAFDPMGEQRVKNIADPIPVFRVLNSALDISLEPSRKDALSLPDKPSIAVLPFQNMSGDPEQDYFADGIVEEIIIELSRMRSLFVIARNSSFTYKGRAVDVKQVGRDLGVRYVLEGSVRKAGQRVRITGQLIDATTGAHLWAERFEGNLEDIFDLQDQVTASVVGAIAPRLEQAEIERARRKPTESLDAYDYFLRGLGAFHQWTRENNTEALRLFTKAFELDPQFAAAYGNAARCYSQRKTHGWVRDRSYEIAEAGKLARLAAERGKDDAVALHHAGAALAFLVGDLDESAAYIDRALALNPNLASAWVASSVVSVWLGEPEVAIERAARAMRLSPQDPLMFIIQAVIAAGHFFAGRNGAALSWAETSIREHPGYIPSTAVAAAAGAFAGDNVAAAKAIAQLRQIDPKLHISNLRELWPIRKAEDFDRWAAGLRKAGLPE